MANFKYNLRPPKNGVSSIFFRLSYGAFEIVNGKKKYTPLEYYINESINPQNWDKENEQATRKGFPQFAEFNTTLSNIKNNVLNLVRRLENDNVLIDNNVLRKEIDKLFNKVEETEEQTDTLEFMSFISHFIANSDRSEGTIKSYKVVEGNLKEFEKKHKTKLTFDSINLDFYSMFLKFLKAKNYTPNTIGTRIKILKTFMSESYERELHTNLDYRKKSFSKPAEETTAVYLNRIELQKLFDLDLSNDKTLSNVRDWFLIGANTGLRFSDLEQLTEENIKDNQLQITTKKTDKKVIVPLSKTVRSILEKHNYKLPRLISNQKFNEYIKDVCELAEITQIELIEETKGTKKSKVSISKHKLISAHTARRSFATNAFKEGVPTIQIMKLTGHRTEKAFLSYIKISEKENAEILQSHPFFN